MQAWENNIQLSNWAPGCRFFSTSDGKHFVVDADLTEYPEGPTRFIRRDTVVLYCTAEAGITDMIPDHVYPPGTTPEQVLDDMGYAMTAAPE